MDAEQSIQVRAKSVLKVHRKPEVEDQTWKIGSQFDLHELDIEARISQRPDCGKNMSKWKPPENQIPRHRN